MKIAGLQKNSTIDYPGMLSSVVFTPGCNFSCYYCHNAAIIRDAESLDLIDPGEVMEFLKKRSGLIDGVVVSGGEATLQDGLADFIGAVKALGYKVKLDTNGSSPDVVGELIDEMLIDFVAVDYKAPLEDYSGICGFDARDDYGVRRTFTTVIESGIDYEIRTTMVPEITPGKLYSMAMAFPDFKRYALQLYVPKDDGSPQSIYDRTNRPPAYTPGQLREMAEKIKGVQPNVFVRA